MLTRTEEYLLLAVHALGVDASGTAVRGNLESITGRRFSIGAVYVPLERLVKRGFLSAREAAPTAKRGGRRRRFYRVTPTGLAALAETRTVNERAWAQVPPAGGSEETPGR